MKALREHNSACFSLPITGVKWHEHPDTPPLLRARRERPRGRCAAEQRDERAPVHCPVPPMLPTKRMAHLSTVAETTALRDFNSPYPVSGPIADIPDRQLRAR